MDKGDFAVLLAPIGKLYHMNPTRLAEYAEGLFYAIGDSDPELLKKAVDKLLKTAGHYCPKPEAFRAAMSAITRASTPATEAQRAGPVKCEPCGDSRWIDIYLSNGTDVVQMIQPCALCNPIPAQPYHNGYKPIDERAYWTSLGSHQLTTWIKATSLAAAFQSGGISKSAASQIITRASNPQSALEEFKDITPFSNEAIE